jgi:hypothetical protein
MAGSIFSGDWWSGDNWSNNLGGLFGNLLKGGANYAAADDIVKRLTEVGSGLAEGFKDLGAESFEKSQFQPFTITSGTGTAKALTDPTTGEFSGVSNTLGTPATSQTTGIQNILTNMLGPTGYNADPTGGQAGTIGTQALGGVGNLLTSVTGDRGTREQSIYDKIRSIQNPEEQRQQQLLNDQLLSQGRLGLSTSMFGGSPEQFAMEKARAEAMNQASLAAMDRAGQERQQDLATASGLFGLGGQASQLPLQLQGIQGQNLGQMMGLQYLPEQMMLEQLGAGTNLASIADEGRRYGTGLFDESTGSGLEAILQAELGKTDFLKSLYSGAVGGSGGGGSSGGGGWFDTIINTIFGD